MTATGSDWLILQGRRRMLFNHPLESYLRGLPTQPRFRIQDPANRLGYIATWEIKPDDMLWLTALQTCAENEGPDPGIGLVFAGATGPVPARWVRQRLRSPDGNQLRYEHLGYGLRYARETYLHVFDGRLVLTEEFDGRTMQRTAAEFTDHLEHIFGPEEGAFIRASHAAPEDSAPRLVYADWLDERSNARGTLIRLAERHRDAPPEAKFRELCANLDLLRQHALTHRLWTDIMGYRDLLMITSLG